jgi:hypothetical protein
MESIPALALFVTLAAACGPPAPAAAPVVVVPPSPPAPPAPEAPEAPEPRAGREGIPDDFARVADEVVGALRARDMGTVSGRVHPTRGVRLSPYAYVDSTDVVLDKDEVTTEWKAGRVRVWGSFDGSGDPIQLTFRDYVARFVYDVDFATAQVVAFDREVGVGNTTSNIAEAYPDAHFVEYHFPGFDPQYDGMDWRSLRIVLVREAGVVHLVGLVHAEWTT